MKRKILHFIVILFSVSLVFLSIIYANIEKINEFKENAAMYIYSLRIDMPNGCEIKFVENSNFKKIEMTRKGSKYITSIIYDFSNEDSNAEVYFEDNGKIIIHFKTLNRLIGIMFTIIFALIIYELINVVKEIISKKRRQKPN